MKRSPRPSTLSRRQTLQCLAALGGTAVLPAWSDVEVKKKSRPILGLQLYSLREAAQQDLAGTLQKIATIGYRTIELAGYYNRTARQLRDELDRAGLLCSSVHVPFQPSPGNWDFQSNPQRLIDDLKTVGAKYAVAPTPFLPDRIRQVLHPASGAARPGNVSLADLFRTLSADDWKRTGDELNEKGALLGKSGLRIAYHNHAMEFLPLDGGQCGLDILARHTDPANVDFELDIGWVVSAGQNPLEWLRKLGHRVRLMHLKDAQGAGSDLFDFKFAPIGAGTVDWKRLIRAIQDAGIEHLFVEQEAPPTDSALQSLEQAYRYLSQAFMPRSVS